MAAGASSSCGEPVPGGWTGPGEPAWEYTVSVRSLCEFTARRGDLDRRFTPTATALEGLAGQAAVAARRGPDYQTELPLQAQWGPLRVRGRADGYDPQRQCLEEVKTLRGPPEEVAENRRALHWAQLQTYGALYCREHGLKSLGLSLVYFDVDSQAETVVHEVAEAAALEAAFVARCERFVGWARQEAAHREQRDRALRSLAFPPGEFRPGQRELAEAVFRAAASGRCLLAQAPTGIGKTLGTLYPMLRAMPLHGLDKLAYLTCKGTGRLVALEALQALRELAEGRALRVLTLVAREQACEHPDKACHGQSCPLARGFHDRLDAARADAVQAGWMDAQALRDVARTHGICPYYLGQELVRWADVLVGDVHHAFDASGQLWGLGQSLDWTLALMVDEAHNLVERARQMYSGELSAQALRDAAALAPAPLRPAFGRAIHALTELATRQVGDYAVLDPLPETLWLPLQALAGQLAEHFRRQPLAVGPLLEFHFELQRLVRLAETLGEHTLCDLLRTDGAAPASDPPAAGTLPLFSPDEGGGCVAGPAREVLLSLRNVVPARFLQPRWRAWHGVVLFSATLEPPQYQCDLLGLPPDTAWLDVPPVFPPGHLTVQVADRLSTRYAHRGRSLRRLVEVIARQFDQHPGNYLAFFSSHEYLHQAASLLATLRPDITQWRQDRQMSVAARQAFLGRFEPEGSGVGFAVLGGVFAEGVDLPGTRLIGAFVATLALPPVSPVQEQFRQRLDAMFGPGHGYADLVPAMQKVVQAAGRVLRTPTDRGWLWLMDERYRQPEVVRLLPAWWGLSR